MSHRDYRDEVKVITMEISHVGSNKKLLAKPALQLMLELINPNHNISPISILKEYVASIGAAEDVVKVLSLSCLLKILPHVNCHSSDRG